MKIQDYLAGAVTPELFWSAQGNMSNSDKRHRERGVTMIFVAIAMIAILAIAALSIDVVTLYLAKEEAQRSADAAALAAARVLALSGVTSYPSNVQEVYLRARF